MLHLVGLHNGALTIPLWQVLGGRFLKLAGDAFIVTPALTFVFTLHTSRSL
jgi:hypothetical protein